MAFKDILRNSLKTGMIFAAIGATVALATPFIMTGLASMGLLEAGSLGMLTLAKVVDTSLVFGLFGVLDPIYKPLAGFIFGNDTPAPAQAAPSVQPTIEPSLQQEAGRGHFTQTIEIKRTTQIPQQIGR